MRDPKEMTAIVLESDKETIEILHYLLNQAKTIENRIEEISGKWILLVHPDEHDKASKFLYSALCALEPEARSILASS
jgi:hypothetical protein